ncbi:uncharacterized protein LOC134827082 [Culicoides brevitarsis]|uniref:uncharacterized protein LOC134827082 n=1 Tax=Culicoides brevitarsis TaxID=469753 RepID=UPI00307C6CFE
MKFFYIFFVAFFAATAFAGKIEDVLNKKVEELRVLMRTGNPELGIPVLAPFETDHFEGSFDFEGLLSWTGEFHNLRIDNLDTFINNKLTFNMLTMKAKFNFTFPDIVVQGFQDIRGHVFTVMPQWAYGDFRIAPVNVRMFGETKIKINRDGFLNAESLQVELYLDEFNCHFENLLTGGDLSDLLNQVIPDIVPSALNNFPERVTAKIQKKFLPIMNMILNRVNVKDIM